MKLQLINLFILSDDIYMLIDIVAFNYFVFSQEQDGGVTKEYWMLNRVFRMVRAYLAEFILIIWVRFLYIIVISSIAGDDELEIWRVNGYLSILLLSLANLFNVLKLLIQR
jgi:hypothetical protein